MKAFYSYRLQDGSMTALQTSDSPTASQDADEICRANGGDFVCTQTQNGMPVANGRQIVYKDYFVTTDAKAAKDLLAEKMKVRPTSAIAAAKAVKTEVVK